MTASRARDVVAFGGLNLGDISIKEADRVALEVLWLRLALFL
ncbi:hypothetical protein [Sphingomonas sp. NFX23]